VLAHGSDKMNTFRQTQGATMRLLSAANHGSDKLNKSSMLEKQLYDVI
jgi:hypothetical protein